jgi:hypothetical protein
LENAYFVKYDRRPAKKSFSPTQATSCFSADAPLAYVMPSKLASTARRSKLSAAIGWVEGSWSWR